MKLYRNLIVLAIAGCGSAFADSAQTPVQRDFADVGHLKVETVSTMFDGGSYLVVLKDPRGAESGVVLLNPTRAKREGFGVAAYDLTTRKLVPGQTPASETVLKHNLFAALESDQSSLSATEASNANLLKEVLNLPAGTAAKHIDWSR